MQQFNGTKMEIPGGTPHAAPPVGIGAPAAGSPPSQRDPLCAVLTEAQRLATPGCR